MTRTEKENLVPVWERITISLEEAAACFVSLRTISECGGIHEPKRNTSQSQTQSTRGI